MKRIRNLFYIKIFFLVFFLSVQNTTFSQAIDQENVICLPQDVEVILSSNAKKLESVSIVLKRTRSTQLPIESLLKQISCLYEYGFFEPSHHIFMWQSPCFYQLSSGPFAVKNENTSHAPFAYEKNLELSNVIDENSFDGKEYMIGSGYEWADESTPALNVDSKEHTIRDFGKYILCDSMFLWAAGYKFPIIGNDLGTSQESSVIYLASRGKISQIEKITDGGIEFLAVEIIATDIVSKNDRVFVFWLMPDFKYANKKMLVKTTEGKIIYEIENDDFVNIDKKNIFLPKKCTINYYSWQNVPNFISNSVLFSELYSIAEISTKKIDDKQFDLRKKYTGAGTFVADRSLLDTNSGLQYTIPANPADLDRVIEAALTSGTFTPTPLPSTGAIIFRWLLIITGITMILYACYTKFVKKTMND